MLEPPLRGIDRLLDGPRLTLLGELHGTAEAPPALLALVAAAARRGHVRVGLELPGHEQARVERFLVAGDRGQLLAGDFWSRGLRDGRNSVAMAELLAAFGRLRASGAAIDCFLIDDSDDDDGSLDDAALNQQREQHMAARIDAALTTSPAARVFVLTGNLHARTVRGSVSLGASYAPLGAILSERHALTSLQLTCRGGAAWCCRMNPELRCGPLVLHGRDRGAERQLLFYGEPDEYGHHGELYLGDVTASPPAVPDPLV